MKKVSPVALLGWVLLANACSTAPTVMQAPSGTIATTLSRAEFPGLAKADLRFDPRSDDASWASGDEVVFALRLVKGTEVRRWVLHLSVVFGQDLVTRLDASGSTLDGLWDERSWTYTVTESDQPREMVVTSLRLPVSVVIRDENGKKLSASLVRLPVHLLGRGVLPAVDLAIAAAAQPTEAAAAATREQSVRPMVDAMIAMMALLNVVQEDEALAQYFWQVVEKPSLWSVVTGLGVRATLSMPFEQSVPAVTLPPGLPPTDHAYVVPLRIDVNGAPALLLDILATDAARPFALCGGMVAAVARHPSKPDVTLELQVLSAQLGKP